MIIGKGGCFIKHLKEKSGAFIQLSQKSKETTLPERVITIIGDLIFIISFLVLSILSLPKYFK